MDGIPIKKGNEASQAEAEYVQAIYKKINRQFEREIDWETLYYEQIDAYNKMIYILLLVFSIIMFGRFLL